MKQKNNTFVIDVPAMEFCVRRKEGENFEDYKKRRITEEKLLKERLKGIKVRTTSTQINIT